MTNSTTPGYPGSADASLGGSTTMGTTSQSTTPGAREEAANLAGEAGEAGRRVAGVAKGETRAVGSEARRQAKRLADQVGSEVRQQAANQQSKAASGLRTIGDEFSNMANGQGSGSGFAATVAKEAGTRVGAAAQWLDDRDPQALLEETKRFARRRPGVFIAIALGAGLVVGRLVRSLAQPSDDGGDMAGGATGTMGAAGASAGTGASYGTGAGAGAGTGYGAAGGTAVVNETVVSGSVAGGTGSTPDPLGEEQWTEGSPGTTRGGI